jgi:hypothetical protein
MYAICVWEFEKDSNCKCGNAIALETELIFWAIKKSIICIV